MREQPARTLGRILAAAVLSGAAVLAAVSPGHAATTSTAQAGRGQGKVHIGRWLYGPAGARHLGRPRRRAHRLDRRH